MSLSLRQISLENFRLFEKLDFPFAPLTVLTGPNSSGKSSIVKALLLLQDNLQKYQLGQLDFTDDTHRLGSFKSTKTRYTQDNHIGITLQYLVTADQKSPLYTLNNEKVDVKFIFAPQNNDKYGILIEQDVSIVSSKVSIFSIKFEASIYSFYVDLNRMVDSIKQRNKNALKPTMHIIRDSIEPTVFETHFAVLRQQFKDRLSQEINNLNEQMNMELETNPELLDLQRQLAIAEIETNNRLEIIDNNFNQWEGENRPAIDAPNEVIEAFNTELEARRVERERVEREARQVVANFNTQLDEIRGELQNRRQNQTELLIIDYNRSLDTLTPGNYHTLIYSAIIDKTNLLLDELTTFTYSFSAKKHKDIANFLNDNEWEAQLVAHLSNIDDTTIEEIITDIPELAFLIAAQKLLPITLGEILKNTNEQSYSQAIQLLIEEIRGLINELLEQLLFEYIDGIRGQQKRFYHLKTEYALDKTIGYLLEIQNKSNKTIKRLRGKSKKDTTRNRVSQVSNENKVSFIEEWLIKFGVIQQGGHIEAEQIDGAFVDIKLYRTQTDWEQKESTSIADLGLGISQLLPIIITTAYHLGDGYLIAIEEPESHLHPKLQSVLADFMVAAIGEGARFLVETHSVYFIRKIEVLLAKKELSSDNLRVCYIKKNEDIGASTPEVVDIEANEDGLNAEHTTSLWNDFYDEAERLTQEKKMLQKFKKELGLTTKCLVLTEDNETEPCEVLLEISGFNMEETKVLSYYRKKNIDSTLISLRLIIENRPNLKNIIIHMDRDAGIKPAEIKELTKKLEQFKKYKNDLFITSGYDIENYFIDPNHVFKISPSITQERIDELIEQAMNDTEETSIEKISITDTKGCISPVKIVKDMTQKYHNDKIHWRYGKGVLERLQQLIQEELNLPECPNLIQKTDAIQVPELIEIAQQIWGNQE
jgi:predicted ATPase